MKITKNDILIIVAAVGSILSLLVGLIGGLEPSIVLVILTVSVVAGVFFFYENPGGEDCTPKTTDPNAVTYVTNKIGLCVPSTCTTDYYVIGDKCQKPTSLPTNWTTTTSNGYVTSSSNIIATFDNTTISTTESCAYTCLDQSGCNVATFYTDANKKSTCTLYKQDDKSDNQIQGYSIIRRPVKKIT